MMRRLFLIATATMAIALTTPRCANPQVEFDTTAGKIRVELYPTLRRQPWSISSIT
jgi:hypothetical protein